MPLTKSSKILVRMTKEEADVIEKSACELNLSKSSYLLKCGLNSNFNANPFIQITNKRTVKELLKIKNILLNLADAIDVESCAIENREAFQKEVDTLKIEASKVEKMAMEIAENI